MLYPHVQIYFFNITKDVNKSEMVLGKILLLKSTHHSVLSAKKLAIKLVSALLCSMIIIVVLTVGWAILNKVDAQDIRVVVRGSGYEVPRFLSLKSDEANMRVGPGNEYPIAWVYRRKGLPLKVIAEYEVWRKVVDHEGTTGWMHTKLLTGRRTALITGRIAKLFNSFEDNSKIVGYAERNVVMELQYCRSQFCRVVHPKLKGWVRREKFWGLLEDETLN